MSPYQSYQAPPPPPTFHGGYQQQSSQQPAMSCVKCSGRRGVYMQNFKKDYIPPVAYLGAFIGILPMLIFVMVLKVSHQMTAPFCSECWTNFSKVSTVETLTGAGFFVGILGGIFAAFAFESVFVFFLFLALSIGLLVWGQIYKKNNSPKFKKIDRKQVIIDDPTFGEVCFVK